MKKKSCKSCEGKAMTDGGPAICTTDSRLGADFERRHHNDATRRIGVI